MTTQLELGRRPLGKTSLYVTPLGLGGAWLGYSPATGKRDQDAGAATVLRALDLGIRLIDTSAGYGESEKIIGMALSQWFRNGGKREDLILSTKTGTRARQRDYTAEGTQRSVEQSLANLGVDYIDVMLVHDPDTLDPVFAPGGALEKLRELKKQGTIRAIGLGVRDHALHRRFIQSGAGEVSLTYGDYNLLNQSAMQDLLPVAAEYRVGIFNAMVVEYGLLSGEDPRKVVAERKGHLDTRKVESAVALWEWAQSRQVNLLSVALQHGLRDQRVTATLVGAAMPEEIEGDVAAFQDKVAEPVWEDLYQRFGL